MSLSSGFISNLMLSRQPFECREMMEISFLLDKV